MGNLIITNENNITVSTALRCEMHSRAVALDATEVVIKSATATEVVVDMFEGRDAIGWDMVISL